VHEIGLGVVEGFADLGDLGQRGGVEMADPAAVEGLQHHGVRIALDRVEHRARELADEAPCVLLQEFGAHAIDRIAGLQGGDHRTGVRKAPAIVLHVECPPVRGSPPICHDRWGHLLLE
jgi:hypothetical protein